MMKIARKLTLVLILLVPSVSMAESGIAFIHTQRILDQAPQAAVAREMLQKEFAPREADIVAMQKQLKEMEEKLARDSAIMSEQARRDMERDILSQQREVKRSRDEFNEDLNIRRSEEFAKLQKIISAAVQAVAQAGDYDLVLENGAVYVHPRIDITDKIIEHLKKSNGNSQ